jgi:hypothetical protein
VRTARPLQGLLRLIGLVAIGFGTFSVVSGAAGVIGEKEASPGVDSELRFYAIWYVIAGLLALRSARSPVSHAWEIRLLAAGFLGGAAGRALSLAAHGRPHVVFVILMGVEVVVALLLVRWLAAARRGASRRSRRII